MGGELWETSLMMFGQLLLIIIALMILNNVGWITVNIHWHVIWTAISHLRITAGK